MALKDWLSEQEPQLVNEIFLDIDPVTGLRAGTQWRRELFNENSRCETVICLLSASWPASRECGTEFRTAEGFGKRIICARLEEVTDENFTPEWCQKAEVLVCPRCGARLSRDGRHRQPGNRRSPLA